MKTLMGYNRGYYSRVALCAIILVLLFGCGEKAKGKDENAGMGIGMKNKTNKTRLMLPDFSLMDLNGKEYRLIDYVGKKPVLLAFWTTGCRFCIKEIPALNKIFNEKQNDLEILSIDILEPPGMVRHLARSKGIEYPVLLDQKGLTARAYNIRGVPSYILVDLEGGMSYYGHDLKEAINKVNELIG